METMQLWRPTGENELALVEASGWRRFPPRLDWQPIFYPVLTEEYATKIARDWNTKDGGIGYVTTFEVDAEFIAGYAPQEAGGRDHLEYWIPAEHLDAFNDAIVGPIRVVAAYAGDPPTRIPVSFPA
jgi:hypothetical protein